MDMLSVHHLRVVPTLGLASIAMLGALSNIASAQSAKDLVSAWEVVTTTITTADGKKIEPFRPDPKGMAIFTADGHYMITVLRADLPKLASNNRMQATEEENAAIARGSIASYGTYSLIDKLLTLKVDEISQLARY